MATKSKIIAGFLFMIALLVGMAALGYERLQSASENFVEFRRLSHLSVDASDLVAAFGVVVTETYHFTDSRDPKYIDKMHRALDEARRLVKETSETMRAPDRQAMLKKIDENIEAYQRTADQMQADILSAYAQYTGVVRKNADSMADSMLTIAAQARGAGNADALYELSQAWDSIALAR
ncbi:MAG: hypothetical protein LBC10_03610, partial [Deltaproteobacteria bacterium]|nr:hypothetical protein [Deltaproteobacteria bacterium]